MLAVNSRTKRLLSAHIDTKMDSLKMFVQKIEKFWWKNSNLNQNNMKLFQVLQQNFTRLGISSNQSRFNRQSVIAFSLYTSTFLFCIFYFLFNANTFLEYTLNIFITTSIVGCLMVFVVVLYQSHKLSALIAYFEEICGESKFWNQEISFTLIGKPFEFFFRSYRFSEAKNPKTRILLNKTNSSVEFWCKIGEIVMIKVTPVFLIFPLAIFSYALYFITNAGKDSFILPFLHWYEWLSSISSQLR